MLGSEQMFVLDGDWRDRHHVSPNSSTQRWCQFHTDDNRLIGQRQLRPGVTPGGEGGGDEKLEKKGSGGEESCRTNLSFGVIPSSD